MESINEYFSHKDKPDLTIGVNRDIDKRSSIINQVKSEPSAEIININKELSKLLIGKQKHNLASMVVDWLSKRISAAGEITILLTDIDILFEPSFGLDPLAIFKQVCKNNVLLVLWPGEFSNDILSYATPEHAHYKTWSKPGIKTIKI